jgi:hypothetical protein
VRRIALCYRRLPVAKVGKAPMSAMRFTEHRTYNDDRYGTYYSHRQWAMTMRLSKTSVGKNSRWLGGIWGEKPGYREVQRPK